MLAVLLERASRRIGTRKLRAVHGRSFFGLIRRHPDQEWRSADGNIRQCRISTVTSDAVLAAALKREQDRGMLRLPSRSM